MFFITCAYIIIWSAFYVATINCNVLPGWLSESYTIQVDTATQLFNSSFQKWPWACNNQVMHVWCYVGDTIVT